MKASNSKPQTAAKPVASAHPSGQKPTTEDALARMTGEGDVQPLDESQAGRQGEGLRGERPKRHQPASEGETKPDVRRPGAGG
jgi:hypothetical protein